MPAPEFNDMRELLRIEYSMRGSSGIRVQLIDEPSLAPDGVARITMLVGNNSSAWLCEDDAFLLIDALMRAITLKRDKDSGHS